PPPPDDALPPDIGGAEQRSVLGVDTRHDRARVHHERSDDADAMAQTRQRLSDAWSDPVLELQHAGVDAMVAKALPIVQRIEPRRLDGLLRPHVEDGDVQEALQGLLFL